MINRRTILATCAGGLALVLASACAPAPDTSNTAHIAVAANFKPAMDVLEADFEAASDYDLTVTTGSTGKLYAQIIAGAPFHVFLAADEKTPLALETGRLAAPSSSFTYAIGQLALWSPDASTVTPDDLSTTRRLAMANPDLAPYGAAADQVLTHLDHAPALALGENVGQAFAFVKTGNADLGFVALSQVLSLPEDQRGTYWLPPASMHAPIRQNAVLLTRGEDNPAGVAFINYLKSDAAGTIIADLGYERD